ncbi:MAG TPA: hypothetical protein PLQ00_16275, partial [Thermoguttaceae bacterium]|nr:hypothetical protein [Thermoguttaceae bacterium]
MSSSTSFEFLHWDPDGQLRRYLDRWFPTHRLSLGGDDTYQRSGAGRRYADVLLPENYWQWDPTKGPFFLTDPETGLPQMPWQYRPPQWILNSLWIPTGADRYSIGLFLTDQWLGANTAVDFLLYPSGEHEPLKLYVLAQLPFTEGQGNQSWLTILVDRRFLERQQMVYFSQENVLNEPLGWQTLL